MKEVINEYNVVPLPVTMSEQQGRFYLTVMFLSSLTPHKK